MNWNSPADFFAMGGYALYVWGSFGACLVFMVLEPWFVMRRKSLSLARIKKVIKANEHIEHGDAS